jgi:hypothetical protein
MHIVAVLDIFLTAVAKFLPAATTTFKESNLIDLRINVKKPLVAYFISLCNKPNIKEKIKKSLVLLPR